MESDALLSPESRALRDIDVLLQQIPCVRTDELTLAELLAREAEALVSAHDHGHPGAAYLIRGDRHRPGRSAATDTEILASALTREQAIACMARWHWFADLSEARRHADEIVDPRFEAACDAIVGGDADALRSLLARTPSLAQARSPFAHHQTLLQHVAANGIEHNRQWQSPANAVEIAKTLIAAGAELDATCDSYGGGLTAMTLLVSSAHPAAAGVQADLVEVLCQAGARADGPDDDGMPLWTAIASGYAGAADALVRQGARVDNLLLAAAVGNSEAVESYFDAAGRLVPARAYSWGRAAALARVRVRGAPLSPGHMLEYALHWAAVHRRRAVVELLLTKVTKPDLTVKEPIWNNTLLESASYGGDADVVALVRPLFEEPGQP